MISINNVVNKLSNYFMEVQTLLLGSPLHENMQNVEFIDFIGFNLKFLNHWSKCPYLDIV